MFSLRCCVRLPFRACVELQRGRPAITPSPSLKSFTAEPVATTVPGPSCEAMQGTGVHMMPSWTMKSVWHSDATAVLRRMSLGPRVLGVGMRWIW